MRFLIFLLLILFAPGAVYPATGVQRSIRLTFYSAEINLQYDEQLLNWRQIGWEERDFRNTYRNLNLAKANSLLPGLLEARKKYQLNDWLYYELIASASARILNFRSSSERELVNWFLLTESGYDTRLAFSGSEIFVYAHTLDEVFEVPLITDSGKTYVNLSMIRQGQKKNSSVYLIGLPAASPATPFSFDLSKMPALPPRTTTRQFTFSFGNQTLPLSIALDQTVVQWMKNYPIIQESAYFEAPFSPTLRASLLPQVKDLIKNKAPMDALALMVALTRSAFRYQEDGDYFGHSKPMIPEEVFYYPFSDCEDRSALLFSLIREFLYFPAIVVAYPNHVTVAVDLPNLDGEFITHKGRRYYICDPTGPSSSSLFNEIPSSFAGQAFEILKEYK